MPRRLYGKEKLLANIVVDKKGCWIWQKSCREPLPYPRCSPGDYPTGNGLRWAYTLYKGPIPEGLIVRHKCDVPSCLNPAHLEVGTHKDNTQDALARGRYVSNATKAREGLVEARKDPKFRKMMGCAISAAFDRNRTHDRLCPWCGNEFKGISTAKFCCREHKTMFGAFLRGKPFGLPQ